MCVDSSRVPLVDCNFTVLPVHFAVDPAAASDGDPSKPSYDRQMSLSQQVQLMAQFLDVEMVPVAQNTSSSSSSGQLLDPSDEMRPRTASWGGRAADSQAADRGTRTKTDTDTGTQRKTDRRRAAEADKKKVKGGGVKADTMSKKLGLLGRAVSKKLMPGARKERVPDSELRERRKMSVGSATQSTRLSCLTDDMLNDHSQVLVPTTCQSLSATCQSLLAVTLI